MLAAKWAALLANATDPEFDAVPPAYGEILKQLSHDDAVLLDHIVASGNLAQLKLPLTTRNYHDGVLQRSGPLHDHARFRVALDNLLRVRVLVEVVQTQRQSRRATVGDLERGGIQPKLTTTLRFSALGAAFVRAVSAHPEQLDIEPPTLSPMRVNAVE